jgi:hypothetical protein
MRPLDLPSRPGPIEGLALLDATPFHLAIVLVRVTLEDILSDLQTGLSSVED